MPGGPLAPVIHWFRQDLRLADNPSLAAACASGRPVIPVYVHDDGRQGGPAPGGAARWWLAGSLAALDQSLRDRGSRLILRRGPAAEVLAGLAKDTGAVALHWSRVYEPGEEALAKALGARLGPDLALECFPGRLLFEPASIRTGAGRPFQVFTAFWKACLAGPPARLPVGAPGHLAPPAAWPRSEGLADWALHPSGPDWSGGLAARFTPGEAAALARLDACLDEVIDRYPDERDRPDLPGTSRLSPHLHFGEISAAQVWQVVNAARAAGALREAGAAAFLRQLGWRDFSAHLLWHFPTLAERPLRPEFAAFPWASTPELLTAWCRGRTGYPIVDAGMRELWHTGWMHNRVRMIVASFLVKDLLIPWQDGAAWFWDTLVDADLANNAASWQWVAGCGADAAPFFRIFNPVLQGRKFDPDGAYVRRWVPELARLGNAHVHAPWLAPAEHLREAAVRLGQDYPEPVVDHAVARTRALEAYSRLRAGRRFPAAGMGEGRD